MGRRAEGFLQLIGAHQRRGAVAAVLLEHGLGDGDERVFLVEFLHAALAWEYVGEVVNAQRLLRGGMDGRQRLVGHVGLNVVPCCGQFVLLKDKSLLFHKVDIFIS